jgi:hypothetical protein
MATETTATKDESQWVFSTSKEIARCNEWIYDTGARTHITPRLELLENPVIDNTKVWTVSGKYEVATHRGNITIKQRNPGNGTPITVKLSNVLCLPNSPQNLISGQQLRQHNVHLRTDNRNPRSVCNGKTVLVIAGVRGKPAVVDERSETALAIDGMDWHIRYGHLPFRAFTHIPEAPPMLKNSTSSCDACAQGKSTKDFNLSHGIRTTKPLQLLQLLHSDLCGLISPAAYNGHKYICTLTNDFSRFTMIKTMSNKSDAAQAVLDLISRFESQFGYKAKALQTDNGGEYRSKDFMITLQNRGIEIKEVIPYYSETNPVAERTNRTIMTIARTSIIQSGLPKKYWPEAVAHALFTKNRIPYRMIKNQVSPIELIKPDTIIQNERSRFRAFGEPVWIHNPEIALSHDKLSPLSQKDRIVGYSIAYSTYRVCTESGKILLTKNPKPRTLEDSSVYFDPYTSTIYDS